MLLLGCTSLVRNVCGERSELENALVILGFMHDIFGPLGFALACTGMTGDAF